MAIYSAHDVAAEIRERLPGVSVKKLHKLLYYAQGFHVAAFGEPLYRDSVEAWDRGPVVASLWRAEKYDPPIDDPIRLDQAGLNTVGYVVSRYGGMTGGDLERLTHSEGPWQIADQRRKFTDDQVMPLDEIYGYFTAHHREEQADGQLDDPSEDYDPPDLMVREWLGDVQSRRNDELTKDNLDLLDRYVGQ